MDQIGYRLIRLVECKLIQSDSDLEQIARIRSDFELNYPK